MTIFCYSLLRQIGRRKNDWIIMKNEENEKWMKTGKRFEYSHIGRCFCCSSLFGYAISLSRSIRPFFGCINNWSVRQFQTSTDQKPCMLLKLPKLPGCAVCHLNGYRDPCRQLTRYRALSDTLVHAQAFVYPTQKVFVGNVYRGDFFFSFVTSI